MSVWTLRRANALRLFALLDDVEHDGVPDDGGELGCTAANVLGALEAAIEVGPERVDYLLDDDPGTGRMVGRCRRAWGAWASAQESWPPVSDSVRPPGARSAGHQFGRADGSACHDARTDGWASVGPFLVEGMKSP